jgi:uncharacterized repeat protein (TIGR01451 family)/LPXTG-motif cell wall-anchored protein
MKGTRAYLIGLFGAVALVALLLAAAGPLQAAPGAYNIGNTPEPTQEPSPEPTSSVPTPEPTSSVPSPGDGRERPDLQLVKRANVEEVEVGQSFEYEIVLTNQGDASAFDIVVEDSLPGALTLEGASASDGVVTTGGSSVRVAIERVRPEQVVTIRVRVTVNSFPENGEVRNVVVLAGAPQSSSLSIRVRTPPPTPTPEGGVVAVAPPAPAPQPAELPRTGGAENGAALALLAAGALLALGAFVRRR